MESPPLKFKLEGKASATSVSMHPAVSIGEKITPSIECGAPLTIHLQNCQRDSIDL
jgi:hypothetical protein